MADFVDRIKLVFDADTQGATKSIGDVRDSVSQADGVFGKMKAGASGAFDIIKNNAGLSMTAAAGAVALFAREGVQAFQELATSAQTFATTAGTSVQTASRWIEVSDDLGVSSDTVAAAMQRLNREAASGKLSEFGITAGNANDRLIQTLQYLASIPNEADRAAAEFALLGKGGAALSPLIANVGSLRDRLKEVQGGKLISDADVASSRALADNMDNLSDAWQAFQLSVGKTIAPMLSDLATLASKVLDYTAPVKVDTGGSWWDQVNEGLTGIAHNVVMNAPGFDLLKGKLFDTGDAEKTVADSTDVTNQSLQEQAAAAQAANDALAALTDATLASFNSQLALQDAADRTDAAIGKYNTTQEAATAGGYVNAEANKAAAGALNDAEQATLAQAAAAAKNAVDTAAATGATLDASAKNAIMAGTLRGVATTTSGPLADALNGYADQLDKIPASKNTNITANDSQARGVLEALYAKYNDAVINIFIKPVVSAMQGTLPGAPGSTRTTTATAAAANPLGLSAAPRVLGAVVPRAATPSLIVQNHITVNAQPLTSPADVGRATADALNAFYRRSGTRTRAPV